MNLVYVDNNATTKVADEVLEAMFPFFTEFYGNPSSIHNAGEIVGERIQHAREQVGEFLGAQPDEIVFTSCGSEGNNTAIKSAIEGFPHKKHLITSSVEHPSVLNVCKYLAKEGYRVTFLPVDEKGCLDIAQLKETINDETCLVSIMWVNNETGVVFPIEEIAELMKSRGVLFHCDAVQAAGKIPIDLSEVPVDFLSISGHKLHAPKGIGALFVRKGVELHPLIIGGHQENGKRAGTENVPYIIGFGKACEMAKDHIDYYNTEVKRLRDRLEEGVLATIPNTRVNGRGARRVANTSNILFHNVEGEAILLHLNEHYIAASTGSACSSGSLQPSSHTLLAMGISETTAHSAVRFSLSRYNTDEHIDWILKHLQEIIKKLRRISPL